MNGAEDRAELGGLRECCGVLAAVAKVVSGGPSPRAGIPGEGSLIYFEDSLFFYLKNVVLMFGDITKKEVKNQ